MFNKNEILINFILLLSVLLTAIFVSYSVHLSRSYVSELSVLSKKRDDLQIEWERLLLEINMLAGYNRIETIAIRNLNMQVPAISKTRIINLDTDGNRE